MRSGPKLRVVVADNDPGALDLVTTDLRLEGHEIVGRCLDGTTAIDHVPASSSPTWRCSTTACRRGRTGSRWPSACRVEAPGVRVIVYTNYQDIELIEAVRACGATYLPKGSLRTLRQAVLAAAGSGLS